MFGVGAGVGAGVGLGQSSDRSWNWSLTVWASEKVGVAESWPWASS